MNYSPYDDDEDLDAWITQQANDASLSGLLEPDSFGAQSMPMYQAPPHTEMAPLNYDTGPDWSDALGAGTTALAALADLGLNKGKGTGQILAAGGQFGQARAEQRLRGTQDAIGYEQQRARMQYEQGLRSRNDEIARGNLAARNAEIGEMRARRLGKGGAAGGESAARANYLESQAYKNWNAVPETADPAEAEYRRAQTEKLRAETEVLKNPALAAAKPDSPDLAYRKGRDAERDEADRAKADAEAAELAELRTPLQGTKITNEGLWNTASGDKVQRRKLAEGVNAYQSAWRALERMKEIRSDSGTEITKSAASGEYKTLSNELLAAVGTAANAGVLQPSDITRFQEQVPELSPQWSDLMRLIPGHSDPTLDSLKGTGDALRGSARVKAGGYGFEYDPESPVWLTDRQRAARPQQPAPPLRADFETQSDDPRAPLMPTRPPPRGATGPSTQAPGQAFNVPLGARGYDPLKDTLSDVNPGGDALGATAGRRLSDIPKIPAQPGGGGVPMRTPSGNIGMVPPDRIQAAIAAGWKPAQ